MCPASTAGASLESAASALSMTESAARNAAIAGLSRCFIESRSPARSRSRNPSASGSTIARSGSIADGEPDVGIDQQLAELTIARDVGSDALSLNEVVD